MRKRWRPPGPRGRFWSLSLVSTRRRPITAASCAFQPDISPVSGLVAMLTCRWHNTAQCPFGRDIRMPSFATLRPISVRRWFYHMDITFEEAGQFSLVDLQSQLAASGWPYHVQSVVTAPPKAATNLAFHREVWGGKSMIIVTWAPPAAGQPVPTGSTVTGTGCGTLQSSSYADAAFIAPSSAKTTCTATVSLLNSAGSSPPATATARI